MRGYIRQWPLLIPSPQSSPGGRGGLTERQGVHMNMANIPVEISIGGIYFPPIMFAILLGVVLAGVIAKLLNRFSLTRFIWHPPLFFIALSIVCTRFVDVFIIPV